MKNTTFSPLQYTFDAIHRLELELAAYSGRYSPHALPEYEDFLPPALTWLGRLSKRLQLVGWIIIAVPCVAIAFVCDRLRRHRNKP